MKWYSYKPVDTMFFRGAEPLEKGISHVVSTHFPPPSQTISGALRTACLRQNSISINDYYKGNVQNEILEAIGRAGDAAPFQIIGPIFKKNDIYYIPAPYSWYYEEEKNPEQDATSWDVEKIYQTQKTISPLIRYPHAVQWIKSSCEEPKCAGGNWISLDTLVKGTDSLKLFSLSYFYAVEERTGIALDSMTGMVKEGHLFSMNHVRLGEDIEIAFGVDRDLPLADRGIFTIGGEQRFGYYSVIEEPIPLQSTAARNFLTLSPVATTYNGVDLSESVIASGKITYIGGWDMKKGFHKEMIGYYPAGTVFNRKINTNCFGLMEDM